jgi:hypothetical protein
MKMTTRKEGRKEGREQDDEEQKTQTAVNEAGGPFFSFFFPFPLGWRGPDGWHRRWMDGWHR